MKEGEKDCDEIAIREFCTGKEMKMIYIRRVELCEELHSFTGCVWRRDYKLFFTSYSMKTKTTFSLLIHKQSVRNTPSFLIFITYIKNKNKKQVLAANFSFCQCLYPKKIKIIIKILTRFIFQNTPHIL